MAKIVILSFFFARASVSFIFSHAPCKICSLGFEGVLLANSGLLQELFGVGDDASAQSLDVVTILLSSLLLGLISIFLDFSLLILRCESIPLLGRQLAETLRRLLASH